MGAAHPALDRPVSSLCSREQRSPWKSPKQLHSCCVAICFVQDFGTRLRGEPCSSCPREGKAATMILWDTVCWEPGLKHPAAGNPTSWFQNDEGHPVDLGVLMGKQAYVTGKCSYGFKHMEHPGVVVFLPGVFFALTVCNPLPPNLNFRLGSALFPTSLFVALSRCRWFQLFNSCTGAVSEICLDPGMKPRSWTRGVIWLKTALHRVGF